MAHGIGENPNRSPAEHVRSVTFPATRDEIVEAAGDSEAPVEVINFLKSLPKEQYGSVEEAMRDFGEAERRFGAGTASPSDRDARPNLGRADDDSRHP